MYSFYYMLSHSVDWHLLDVVYNILKMPRYVTSVAGHRHAASMVRGRREAASISAAMKTFDCYDIVRQFYPSDMASLALPTRRDGKTCCENVWTTTGFCDMKNLPRSLSRHARSKNNIQNQNCLKNFWKRNDILWFWTNSGDYVSQVFRAFLELFSYLLQHWS